MSDYSFLHDKINKLSSGVIADKSANQTGLHQHLEDLLVEERKFFRRTVDDLKDDIWKTLQNDFIQDV